MVYPIPPFVAHATRQIVIIKTEKVISDFGNISVHLYVTEFRKQTVCRQESQKQKVESNIEEKKSISVFSTIN